MKKLIFAAAIATAAMTAAPAMAQNLIVNGGFEQSTSPTVTPTGWTSVGHSDGVIPYASFGTPAYQGNYYYDFGGYGNSNGPAGDGIFQTVATSAGTTYALNFGLSSENSSGGSSVLYVYFNDILAGTYTQAIDSRYTVFQKPFVTQTLNFTATSASTQIKFIQGANIGGTNGSNDPLIDGVSFAAVSGAVPEPATWLMMIAGFGMIGGTLRRRSAVTTGVRYA